MGLDRVLSRLESNENTFNTLSNQYGQDVGEFTKNEQKAKLDSISKFSQTLSEHLVREKEEENERLEDEGKIEAIEEDMEKQEEEGDPGIPEEEKIDYYAGVKFLKDNKLSFDSAALKTQEDGGSFQESEEVRNLSGWKLYGYTKQKAIMAGENYKPWMEGEMANNNEMKISYGGRDFTPSQAQTLPEKSVAMGALRRQYLKDQGLLGINRVLLADNFYNKAIESHGQIMAQYQKEDAVNRSFVIEEQAVRDFRADKDFGALVSTLAPLWDKNGKRRGRRGALDKAIDIVKGQMDIGELNDEQLAEIRKQTTTVNGKEEVVGKYWATRFDRLEEDLIAEQNENLQSELTEMENDGKRVEIDFKKWKREQIKNGKEITDAHMKMWSEISYQATGDYAPSWITDFKTKEDRDDEDDKTRLRKLRQSRGFLVESDLDDVSEDVFEWGMGFVQKDKPLADAPKYFDTEAKQKIRGWTNKVIVNINGAKDDTPAYNEGFWNAYRDYNRLFAQYIRKGEPHDEAQKRALEDVEKNFALDQGDKAKVNSKYWTIKKLVPDGKRVPSQVVQDIGVGIKEIKKYSTKQEVLNGLSETVIPGSEAYLIEGRRYKEGKIDNIPHYYRRLAESFKDLSSWDILDAQLKADGEAGGLGDKPEVEKILDDKLLEGLKKKLNKYTTSNQLEQAKYDVDDLELYTSGLFAYSIFNTDETLLTPGLYETVV